MLKKCVMQILFRIKPILFATMSTRDGCFFSDLCLPARWKKILPKVDQQWISKTLFCWAKSGGVELVPEHPSQLGWYASQQAVAVNSIPGVDRYIAPPLFLWMPRKEWKVKHYCPIPSCKKQDLASAGIN